MQLDHSTVKAIAAARYRTTSPARGDSGFRRPKDSTVTGTWHSVAAFASAARGLVLHRLAQ